ncbi:MAG: Galanin, partial [Planctomycetota bacterium]
MALKKTLEVFYETELRPVIEAFEAQRKGILKKVLVIAAASAACAAAAGVFLYTRWQNPQSVIVPIVLAAVAIGLGHYFLTEAYTREFKKKVILPIVKFVDPGLDYRPERFIPQVEFERSRLFQRRIDRYRGEDFVSGTLEKTAILFSEIHAEYKTETTDSKGNRRTQWHTIFKGLYFIADFNKDFKGLTIVRPD